MIFTLDAPQPYCGLLVLGVSHCIRVSKRHPHPASLIEWPCEP